MAKIIGFGVLIWVVMLVVGFVLGVLGMGNSMVTGIIIAIVMALLALWLAGYLRLTSAGKAFLAGIIWVVIGLVLDYFITQKFMSGLYSNWLYWVSYLLILLMPMFRVKKF